MDAMARLISGELIVPHLTKREYFAAAALTGEIARMGVAPEKPDHQRAIVERCVTMADLLIERLAR
jgi:hypothetical protein